MANPIKYADLFDFTSEEGIKQAIKTIKGLNKVYNDFANSAKSLKTNYVSSTNEMIKAMEALNTSVSKLNPTLQKDQQQIAATSKQMDILFASTNAMKGKTVELDGAISKLEKERRTYNESSKKTQAIHEEAIRLEAKLGKLSGVRAKEEAVLKQQILEKNKALKQAARETLGLVSIYDKEVATLNRLRKTYKDVALSEGEMSKNAIRLQKEITTLDSKIKRVDASAGQFQRSVGNYPKTFNMAASSARQLLGAFGIVGGISMFAYLAKDTFELVKETEKLNKALKQVTGSTEEYNAQVTFLRDISDRYGVNLNTLTEAYTKFYVATKNTNLEGKETQRIFDSVAKASAVMGLSAEDSEGALKALGQMISKGKVQAEELRGQLGDRLPGAFQIMARALNVSNAELDKMLVDGKLIAEDVLPKFATELTKTFGLDKIQSVETLASSQTRLKNAWIEFVQNVEDGSGIISRSLQGLMGGFVSLLKAITAFDSDKVNIWEKLGLAISPLISYLLSAFRQENEAVANQAEKTARALELEDEALRAYNIAIQSGIKSSAEFMAVQDEFTISNATAADRLIYLKNILALYDEEIEESKEKTSDLTAVQIKQIDQYRALIDQTRNYKEALSKKEIDEYIKASKELYELTNLQVKITGDLAVTYDELNNLMKTPSLDFGDELDEFMASGEGANEILEEQKEALKEAGDQADTWKDKLITAADSVKLALETAFEAASIAVNQFFDNKSIRRENDFVQFEETQNTEIERLNAQKERELENENLTAEAKAAINRRYEGQIGKIEDDIDRKRVALQRKQARAAKAQALFNIALNTAMAIAKTIGQTGFFGIPLTVIVGALGAAQFAAAASQPLPQYAKGTDNAEGGLSIVGEKGRELVREPSGKTYLTGGKAELRDIPKGSQVLTNAITERILRQREVDQEIESNNKSSSKLQKVAQQDKIGNYIEEIKISHQKETDTLIRGFNQAIKNLPEIHQFHFGRDGLRKDVKIGNKKSMDVKQENSYGR